ncbi:MAG TPA: hypothetical protein ENK19_02385 [Acidobacteria bacterium]|nr:hypothetical protein [Acidobacteriota bacterium]
MSDEKNFPTMIIPAGTEIGVNERGQLSIRTPGNLVIQNSGSYSLIESSQGSVRIDPDVKVEAVSILAADSCFIAGELTAWKVKAQKITLEKGAQAYIMLQQSENLELDRSARLVGNFASDKELYLLLGRFSRELRQLPQELSPGGENGRDTFLPGETRAEEDPFVAPDGEDEPSPAVRQDTEETLDLVRIIFERELARADLMDPGRSALESLLEMVRDQRMEELEKSYSYLIAQVPEPSAELGRSRDMLARLFAT